MDNELFELCREVYKKTGWKSKKVVGIYEFWHKPLDGDWFIDVALSPASTFDGEVMNALYTSDYLLEKLQSKKGLAVTKYVEGGWNAHCERKMHGNAKWVDYYEGDADTPLKALLKLTLALSDAGELPTEAN